MRDTGDPKKGFGCLLLVLGVPALIIPPLGIVLLIAGFILAFVEVDGQGATNGARLPAPDIVGESNYQAAIASHCKEQPRGRRGVDINVEVTLEAEPDNPVDPQAVRVALSGQTVGYVSRKSMKAFGAEIRRLCAGGPARLKARVRGGPTPDRPSAMYGVFLDWPPA